jgi:hypothetical protein
MFEKITSRSASENMGVYQKFVSLLKNCLHSVEKGDILAVNHR